MSDHRSLKQYSLSVAQQDIPSSMMSDPRPRLVNTAARRIVSISSQSGDVQPGQNMRFQLPAGMGSGFLLSGSAYLKFTISVTQATAYSWAFKQSGSGASCFYRASMLLSGASIESIQNYNKLYGSLIQHCTNLNYATSDGRIHEGLGSVFDVQTATVCIPIALGVLNSRTHLPLFLCNSAELQFDCDSLLESLTQLSANALTGYTISQASVCFEQVVPEPAFEQGVKSMLAGSVFQMPIDTFMVNRYAHQGSITQTIGCNSSSVRAVLWNSVAAPAQDLAGYPVASGQTSAQVFADGGLVHQSRLVMTSSALAAESFAEMNRALNNIYDVSRTSVAPNITNATPAGSVLQVALVPLTRTTYEFGAFLGGISLTRENLDNASFSFSGTPVQNLVVAWQGTALAGGQFYVYVALQQIVVIGGDGNANLIR